MVKRKLSFLFIFIFCNFFTLILNANPNADQWMESDKTYKDLIDDGFEVNKESLERMQDRAHRYCFIANSLSESVEVNINKE